uniref:(northern house mosquito) hypothetical protein n=1 Tax=Culex pipiens TaxID=7175 RepID=A0A8D8BVW8_CULPI
MVQFEVGDSSDECFDFMNEYLLGFSEWLKWKKLQLNIAKTKCIVVTTRQNKKCRRCVQMDCGIVKRVETIKRLGFVQNSAFWRLVFWQTTFWRMTFWHLAQLQ